MKTHSVTFLPTGKTVSVAPGTSILEAATEAGISISSTCGGKGVCGKCRVTLKSGKIAAEPNIFLSPAEIERGLALACQVAISDDLVVEVSLASRIEGVPQLPSEDAIQSGAVSRWVGEDAVFPHNPLARKEYLELPEPTITDNLFDQERIYRELRRDKDIPMMQTGLAILRKLPPLLRENNWQATALLGYRGGTIELVDVEPGDTSDSNFGVAVDLGTTTVVAHLLNLSSAETLATKAKYNSQINFGEDVIARIMYASTPARLKQFQELAVDDINHLIAALVEESGVNLSDVTFILCAGNTTMSHLLLGLDPANIRRDPYIPCASFPPPIRAAEIGLEINSRGLLALMPAVASYVGGDVVGDVLVSGMTTSSDLSLLIDLGTNGELVVGNSEFLLCCSASAGPSFEGGGITCGMRATTGAIEHIDLGKNGKILTGSVVGDAKPLGICGSGLIDAVAELLRAECIDRRGRFQPDTCWNDRVREREDGEKEFVLFPGKETAHGQDIVLTEADIDNLIHSKGSIYMAAECLLEHMDLSLDEVAHVYIAGGFGNYLDIPQAVRIGLLPDLDRSCFQYIGNGSVQGAKLALLSQEALRYVDEKIAGPMTYLELSSNHKYMNEYSSCLFLPHTDLEKFPSLAASDKAKAEAKR